MKHTSIITSALWALLVLSGCSSEDTPENLRHLPPVVGITPLLVESAGLSGEVSTRAALGAGQQIGVFLAAGNGYTACNNYQYNFGNPWAPANAGNTIYLGGASAQVCAYHPWTTGLTNSAAIPLTSQVYNAAKDLSYATNRAVDGSSANKSTTFAMTRAYAKLTLTFQRANYPCTCQIQKVEIKNCLKAANLNITNGVYSGSAGSADVTLTETKNVTVPTTGTVAWGTDWLMVPCTPATGGMTLVLTVDGKTLTTTIPAASYKPVKGEYKTILLSINGTALNITSVTITDWPASTTIDDGGKPFIPLP